MARYRDALPQVRGGLFLADGGIETSLMSSEGLDLPDYAAFPLLADERGRSALRRYFVPYVVLARRFGAGLVLESPTWRASADWGERLGYTADDLSEVNRSAVRLLEIVRQGAETGETRVVVSGNIGPRSDGFDPETAMSAIQAEEYHRPQVETFAATDADMVAAFTLAYVDEAIGIARAAELAGVPVAVSFTVETDGRLAGGSSLEEAIGRVDEATGSYPAYYMINCAHPLHFSAALLAGGAWVERVRGLRANASRLSHEELYSLPEPDAGDLEELGREYAVLRRRLPHLTVFGGCCGTDHRHIEHIAAALAG